MTLSQRVEEDKFFGRFFDKIGKVIVENHALHIFNARRSAGSNNDELAQVMAAYDISMNELGWKHPLSDIVTDYQASVDAKSHDDYKDIATIEELDRRLAMRRSSAYSQQQQGTIQQQ